MAKNPGYIRGKTTRGFPPPPEVLRYFRDKGLRPRFSWLDVWGEEHAHAFTVAKAVELDVLQAFRKTIDKAIAEGQSFETWRETLKPELEKLGWWGRRQVKDPTNAFRKAEVDFSKTRRLQTVFWSNMRAARAAGQWQRIQRSKRALPLILYVRTASADPRPEHLAFAGTILPVDHPFWRTHFPPNGWGCKCTVRAITAREAESYRSKAGFSFEQPPVSLEKFINRRTGEVTQVPAGIDPGWHTNPGLARARTLTQALQDKLQEAGPKRARASIKGLWEEPADMRLLMGLDSERIAMPAAVAEAAQAEFDAQSPIVVVYNDGIRKKTAPPDNRDPMRFALAQRILDEGEMVDEAVANARTWLATIGGQTWKLVLYKSGGGYLRIRTLHLVRPRDARATRTKAEARGS